MMEQSLSIAFAILILLSALPFVFGTFSLGRDLLSETKSRFAVPVTAVTAGGSGDDSEITGRTIDLLEVGKAESAVFEIQIRATCAEDKTIEVEAEVETSPTGSGDWVTLVAAHTILTLTGDAGGSTEYGVGRVGVDLTKAQRYIRVMVTPDMSASATDTATVAGVAVFGGLQSL